MSATLTNGTRKSLADQLDRFDAMLDGLADAIPEAVADAVRAAVTVAVREAVQNAITEVLTNPEVLARIRAAGTPATPTVVAPIPCSSSSTSRIPSRLRLWCETARMRCAQAHTVVADRLRFVRAWAGEKIDLAVRWRKPVLGGLAAGLAVALAAYLFGPLVGSLLCAASVSSLVLVVAVLVSKHSNLSTN